MEHRGCTRARLLQSGVCRRNRCSSTWEVRQYETGREAAQRRLGKGLSGRFPPDSWPCAPREMLSARKGTGSAVRRARQSEETLGRASELVQAGKGFIGICVSGQTNQSSHTHTRGSSGYAAMTHKQTANVGRMGLKNKSPWFCKQELHGTRCWQRRRGARRQPSRQRLQLASANAVEHAQSSTHSHCAGHDCFQPSSRLTQPPHWQAASGELVLAVCLHTGVLQESAPGQHWRHIWCE